MEAIKSDIDEIYNATSYERKKSIIIPPKYGPIIWPILNDIVKIAVETLKDPLYLVCPYNKANAVIGTKVEPRKIPEKIIPNLLSMRTGIKIPIAINMHARNKAISIPIFLPIQGQKITIGIPDKPTKSQTYDSVDSNPGVSLAIVEINVPNTTYPKP